MQRLLPPADADDVTLTGRQQLLDLVEAAGSNDHCQSFWQA
jgi:hypothetical protein